MRKVPLTSAGQKKIESAIDQLFERLKLRYLGPSYYHGNKTIGFVYRPYVSLTGLYNLAAHQEGVKPKEDVLKGALKVAGAYLDAVKEKTKAQTIASVAAFLHNAQKQGVKTDLNTVLGGHLSATFGKISENVRTIVQTESNVVKNTSIFDAIGRLSALSGQEDPTVFFVIVRDSSVCSECLRLHMMPDGKTPRVWKMSEIKAGYHKKGDNVPCVSGLHPHCRCQLTTLQPGYGFSGSGFVEYRAPGHDELKKQRG